MKIMKLLSALFMAVLVSICTVSCGDDDDKITQGGIKNTLKSKALWKGDLSDGTVVGCRFTSNEFVMYNFPDINAMEAPSYRVINSWNIVVDKDGIATFYDNDANYIAQFRPNGKGGIDYFDQISRKWVMMDGVEDIMDFMNKYDVFLTMITEDEAKAILSAPDVWVFDDGKGTVLAFKFYDVHDENTAEFYVRYKSYSVKDETAQEEYYKIINDTKLAAWGKVGSFCNGNIIPLVGSNEFWYKGLNEEYLFIKPFNKDTFYKVVPMSDDEFYQSYHVNF